MRGKLLTRHKACGLAIALVATSSLSLLTPSFASEGSSLARLVAKSTGLSVVVKADTAPTLALTASDLTVIGDTITGFSASGLAKLNAVTVTGTSIKFPTDLAATKIGKEAFVKKFNKKVKIELPDNIVEIGEAAFATNSAITAVKFGTTPASSKLKTIGVKAFYDAGLSENIQFPDGLETLKDDCFARNELTSVKLPDNIKEVWGRVFSYNKITTADLGKFKDVNVRIWSKDLKSPQKPKPDAKANMQNVVPYGMFAFNNISKFEDIKIPAHVWGIGESAFAGNNLTSLRLPAQFTNIYLGGFRNNTGLKKLTFLTKDDGNGNKIGIGQIDRSAFQNCAIEGHLEFPDKVNQMGVLSFANNKITSVSFGKDSPNNNPLIGGYSFMNNPLETIQGLDTWQFEDYAFQNTKALKNINFDYATPHPTFKSIEPGVFKNGLLKSFNLPAYINNVADGTAAKKYEDAALKGNKGWTDGSEKVALYRVAADGTTYVTDNAFIDKDAKYFVINPVLVKFVAKDQYGNAVTLGSIAVERTRTIKGASEAKNVTSTAVNLADFKLGDKIKFAIPAAPEGYEAVETPVTGSAIAKTADGKYEVTLDPTNAEVVREAAYGDGYKVGYKETVIEIGYKNLAPEPPKPEVKPENPSAPATPGAIQPEKPSTPGAITPESPSTPTTPEAIKPVEPAKPSEPVTHSTPGNPTTPNTPVVPATPTNPTTPTTTVPTENPPTNVPFTPEKIVNSDLIPEGNPVFNIVDEDGTSLGNAEVNKDDGTYTFVKDKRTPKGVAKIRKDNTLEVVKVFDGKTPQGKLPRLPKTGGSSEEGLVLLGAAMLGLGAFFRRKIK
ncbi:MAG: leucine-rich repeat protein [Lachnospiraceae bacterium]|nr:leucine-rich repeat protein [Lachnospiraceae bacterium]